MTTTTKKSTKNDGKNDVKPQTQTPTPKSLTTALTALVIEYNSLAGNTWPILADLIYRIGQLYAPLSVLLGNNAARRDLEKTIIEQTEATPKDLSVLFRASIWFEAIVREELAPLTTLQALAKVSGSKSKKTQKPIGLTIGDLELWLQKINVDTWKGRPKASLESLLWLCKSGRKKFTQQLDILKVSQINPPKNRKSKGKDKKLDKTDTPDSPSLSYLSPDVIGTMAIEELQVVLENTILALGDMAITSVNECLAQFVGEHLDMVERSSLAALESTINKALKLLAAA